MFEELWWLLPLLMIVLCFFMMRGSMCGIGSHKRERRIRPTDSALDMLDKRYAVGEISKEEYKERKLALSQQEKL